MYAPGCATQRVFLIRQMSESPHPFQTFEGPRHHRAYLLDRSRILVPAGLELVTVDTVTVDTVAAGNDARA